MDSKFLRMSACVLATGLLAGCGGGGGGRSSSGPITPPAPPTVVRLAVTSAPISAEAAVGDAWSAEIAVTVTVQNLGGKGLFIQTTDASGNFDSPVSSSVQAGAATVRAPLSGSATIGDKSGVLQLRACEDSACAKPYDGATASVGYTLKLNAVPDWTTHQGNPGHTGYLHIRLDPTKFAKAWEWTRPVDGGVMTAINPVVSGSGRVYLSTSVYFDNAQVLALNEVTGQQAWAVPFPSVPAMNPPAVVGNELFVATTGHEKTFLWKLAADTGSTVSRAPFGAQWPSVLSPTIFEDAVYTNGGYYGGYVYAYDRATGTELWNNGAGDDDMSTPAVDSNYVYHYSGTGMVVLDRATGTIVKRIPDPASDGTWGYSYHAAPVIGSHGNVIAYSGSAFSGRGDATTEQFEERPLVSFNIAAGNVEWTTARKYNTAPAVAGGVVYAASKSNFTLDAIDEATGQILWSWSPGPSLGDTAFHRNIIATRTHLFVSTDASVYAIDLSTRASVWRHPEPGQLAITSNRTLLMVVGGRELTGKLVAVKLR